MIPRRITIKLWGRLQTWSGHPSKSLEKRAFAMLAAIDEVLGARDSESELGASEEDDEDVEAREMEVQEEEDVVEKPEE